MIHSGQLTSNQLLNQEYPQTFCGVEADFLATFRDAFGTNICRVSI